MKRRAALALPVLLVVGAAVAAAGPALGSPGSAGTATTATKAPVTHIADLTATVSPAPGARFAEAATQLSFQGVPARDLTGLVVRGSTSGLHTGRIIGYSNGNGGSFVPTKKFATGERVTVAAPFQIQGGRGRTFTFTVARPAPQPMVPIAGEPITPQTQSFVSSDVHPAVHTRTIDNGTLPGDVFSAPNGPAGLNGLEIDDAAGNLIYYKHTDDDALDFREQKYHGQPVLTWWEGAVESPGYGLGSYYIADTSYRIIKHFTAGNGLVGDTHEFAITPQNTALITSYPAVQDDDSALTNGSKQGDVLDGVVQEIDLATNAVMFEWHALDHISLADTYANLTSPVSTYLDAVHINSIQPYGSGQLLVSLRNLHQLISFSRTTGVVGLRIGGVHPNVSEPAAAFTQSQHDAEPHSDGTISLFDNGAGVGTDTHATSRGLVLKVTGRTVSVVSQFLPMYGELAPNSGGMQLVAGGALVDYGAFGSIVLYNSNGSVLNYTRYQPGVANYRAFKSVWHATPTTGPTLAATLNATNTTVSVSWNGATEITSWRILGGADAAHLATIATVTKTGFETTVPVSATTGVLEAQALDANGNTLGASTPLSIG